MPPSIYRYDTPGRFIEESCSQSICLAFGAQRTDKDGQEVQYFDRETDFVMHKGGATGNTFLHVPCPFLGDGADQRGKALFCQPPCACSVPALSTATVLVPQIVYAHALA